MAREEIIKCDICGIDKRDLPKHWSSHMGELFLAFRNFPNIQKDIQVKDCCMNCAKKIYDDIWRTMNKLTKAK